jgi:hypothetical protein
MHLDMDFDDFASAVANISTRKLQLHAFSWSMGVRQK